jgi:hypothetical protein
MKSLAIYEKLIHAARPHSTATPQFSIMGLLTADD